MFKVTTDEGVLVNRGQEKGSGLPEETARADAEARNQKAEEMGLKVRYEVRPITQL